MPLFRKGAAQVAREQARASMLRGTGLDAVPVFMRNRVLRIAKVYGWAESEWPTKRACRALARAARTARDRVTAEGNSLGLDEADRLMHRMTSALGLELSDL